MGPKNSLENGLFPVTKLCNVCMSKPSKSKVNHKRAIHFLFNLAFTTSFSEQTS